MPASFFRVVLTILLPLTSFAQISNSYQETFNELWTKLDDRYALFDARGVDWDALKTKYEPMVGNVQSEQELFNICCEMLSELNDAHTSLWNNEGTRCNSFGFPDSPSIIQTFGSPEAFWDFSDATLMANGFSRLKEVDDRVFYSETDQVGYIRLNQLMNTYGGFAQALEQLKDKEALILDIRLNRGGEDHTLHRIAGRFVDESYISHYKETRIPKSDLYTSLRSWEVKPGGPFQYLKPVMLLTSDFTVSAGDVFTMALKGRPNVQVIGTPTNGSMSHVATQQLKNGWRINYSNKRTYSNDMVIYEGKGVPPDHYVESTDTTADKVILKALELLED